MPKMTLQYFFDMNTTPEHMQIINVSAGGEMIQKRLQPFFAAYKYFKLGKVKLSMIPASTLPVDPTGLSYELGENTVDPRDQLTPGLVRITNGEDIQLDLSNVDADLQHKIFNTMMLDRRWFKWSLQRGLKKSAMPLYWDVGNLHQNNYPDNITNILGVSTLGEKHTDTIYQHLESNEASIISRIIVENSDPRGLFQTGKKFRLGWLPTDSMDVFDDGTNQNVAVPGIHPVPAVPLFTIILPPAYKTKYFYRVYVTETVYFREPVVNNFEEFSSLDRFIRPGAIIEAKPTDQVSYEPKDIVPGNDGSSDIPGQSPTPPGPAPYWPPNPQQNQVFAPTLAQLTEMVDLNGVIRSSYPNAPKSWVLLKYWAPSGTMIAWITFNPTSPGSYPQFDGDGAPLALYQSLTDDVKGALKQIAKEYWESTGRTVLSTSIAASISADPKVRVPVWYITCSSESSE